jgi:hypothetical protein
MASMSQRLQFVIAADSKGAVKAFEDVGKAADKGLGKADDRLDKLGSRMVRFGAGAMAFAGVAAVGLKKLADAASDLGESVNKAGEIFGDSTDDIEKFGEAAARSIGMSKREAIDAAAQFGVFGRAANLTGEELVGFSTDLVSLAADMGSFNNVPTAEVLQAISSALAGQSRPMQRFGVLLNDETLKARAFAMEIYDGSGALTGQQKVLAAHAEIMAQTTIQQGDFGRTLGESLPNQAKAFAAELENLKAGIGQGLLPMFLGATKMASGLVGEFNKLSDSAKATIGTFAGLATAGIGLLGMLSFVGGQVIKMRTTFAALGGASMLGPIGAVAASIGLIALAFQRTEQEANRFKVRMEETARITQTFVQMMQGGATSQDVLTNSLRDLVQESDILRDALLKTNIPFEHLVQQSLNGSGALNQLLGPLRMAAIEAGYTREEAWGLTDGLHQMAKATWDADAILGDLASAGAATGAAMDAASGAALDYSEAQRVLEESTKRSAAAQEAAGEIVGDILGEISQASQDLRDRVTSTMVSNGRAFLDFSDKSTESLSSLRGDLNQSIWDLTAWQNNLIAIAERGNAGFAEQMAELGPEYASVIAELAASTDGDFAATMEAMEGYTSATQRGMADEFAKVDPAFKKTLDGLAGMTKLELIYLEIEAQKQAFQVGKGISEGTAAGVTSSSKLIADAVRKALRDGMAAGKDEIDSQSPSRLFAEEVGHPIAEGIAEGIVEEGDQIADALVREIQSAERAALDAVDDLVDSARDRFSGAFDEVDDRRSKERLVDNVADAEERLSDAKGDAKAAKAERDAAEKDVFRALRDHGEGSEEYAAAVKRLEKAQSDETKAVKAVADANDALTEANYRLLRSSEDLVAQGPKGREEFRKLGKAAGLTDKEISKIVNSYHEMIRVQAEAAKQSAAITAEADAVKALNREFNRAVKAGLVTADQLNHLKVFGAGSPLMAQAIMQAILAGLPKFHDGGVVPGRPGQEVPIMAQAGEIVSKAGGPSVVINVGGNINGDRHLREMLDRWSAEIGDALAAGRRP